MIKKLWHWILFQNELAYFGMEEQLGAAMRHSKF